MSTIDGGEYNGKTLESYIKENSGCLGTLCKSDSLPILIKFIDAQGSLDEINQEAGDKDKFIVGIIGNSQIAYEVLKSIPEVKQCDILKQDKKISEFIIKQIPGTDIRVSLTKELSKNDLAIASLRSATLTLEEIFIKLTNADSTDIDDKEVKPDDSDI